MRTQTTIHSRLAIALLVVPPAALYLIMLFSPGTVAALTSEDGFVETLGALFLLTAAVAFLLSFGARRHAFYLLFGLLILFGTLEEISYGQRIFGFATPSFFEEHNIQHQLNFHNLEWFDWTEESDASKGFVDRLVNVDRLFSLFWFGYCVLVPVACFVSVRAWRLTQRIHLPIVPVAIALVFVLNYLVSKVLEAAAPSQAWHIVEIKETNFAYLLACFAILEYVAVRATRREAVMLDGTSGAGLRPPS